MLLDITISNDQILFWLIAAVVVIAILAMFIRGVVASLGRRTKESLSNDLRQQGTGFSSGIKVFFYLSCAVGLYLFITSKQTFTESEPKAAAVQPGKKPALSGAFTVDIPGGSGTFEVRNGLVIEAEMKASIQGPGTPRTGSDGSFDPRAGYDSGPTFTFIRSTDKPTGIGCWICSGDEKRKSDQEDFRKHGRGTSLPLARSVQVWGYDQNDGKASRIFSAIEADLIRQLKVVSPPVEVQEGDDDIQE